MQRIVVLDGYTLNPGDITWTPFERIGKVEVHDRTPEPLVVERARGAAIVLTNKVLLRAPTLRQLDGLAYIGVLATGTNVVDLEAARERGVAVTNVPGYGTDSVAQHIFALLLELVSHTSSHGVAVHEGDWVRSPDFSFTVAPMTELAGKTLGIVGLGSIGRRVARIGAALGMNIAAAHQRSMNQVAIPGVDVRWLATDDLFHEADVLTLHCPLTDQTKQLVNAARLATMKPTAILINTGRGSLVDEAALADALAEGRIASAGLDVLGTEPPSPNNPLLTAPRCLITPHVAWATTEARTRLMRMAADNLRSFLDGKPRNVVN